MKRSFSLLLFAFCAFLMSEAAFATTWYVRPDGGTRFSSYVPSGQCNGQSDTSLAAAVAANGGKAGTNMACAFGDFRWLYTSGAYTLGPGTGGYGWVISGGDTVLVRGSLGSGTSYRIGWNNPNSAYDASTGLQYGLAGDPYDSIIPAPPSGSATQPTRILGENYASCSAATAKTQLHGGYGIYEVLNMIGTSYVDVECFDITDWSSCGLQGQRNGCTKDIGSLSDYAKVGVVWSNTANNDTLKNIHIHGMAAFGMTGSTGNGVVMSNIDMIGNASSGWNADDGTTGIGSTLVQNFNISWNGCAEEYPMVDALPYGDCTDDNGGGYGDGFGTATVLSLVPWNVTFDQGTVSYNTQDGLDALHLVGAGSSMKISRVLAYGNMGQQIKNGGANGVIENSVIVGNCYAMQGSIPGTPAGYNAHLSDFCRAANNAVVMSTGVNATMTYRGNTLYSSNAIGIYFTCDGSNGICNSTSKADFRDNIFIGFQGQGQDDFPTPLYVDGFPSGVNPMTNPGSYNSNNVTYHAKSNWTCPAVWAGEQNALCGDPALSDETFHSYGYNNATPLQGSQVIGTGVAVAGMTVDFNGNTRPTPPSRGAIEVAAAATTTTTTTTGSTTTTTGSTTSTTSGSTSSSSSSSSSAAGSSSSSSSSSSSTKASGPATTTTALSDAKGPSTAIPAILTAKVTSASGKVPTGTVVLYSKVGNIPLITGTLNSAGTVSWQVPAILSKLVVYAVYNGNASFSTSTSTSLDGSAALATLTASK